MTTDGKKSKTIFKKPMEVINHDNRLCKQDVVKESLIWSIFNGEERIAKCCNSDDSKKCQIGLQKEKWTISSVFWSIPQFHRHPKYTVQHNNLMSYVMFCLYVCTITQT
jgi:hypothetical protein